MRRLSNARLGAGLFPVILLVCAGAAEAAPKLRLTTAALGPVSTAQGSNGAAQVVEAYNAGDGALSLQAASSAPWLTASVGAARPCSARAGDCLPVNIQLGTASLAAGRHTGLVTVSDPNALDAPQNITVTVQVGGGLPDSLNLYVAPGGAPDELVFNTNQQVTVVASTASGGSWLSVSLDGSGSFRFTYPYRVQARHIEGLGEGTYNGSLAVTGSQLAVENKTVPVTLQVTTQPIAQVSPGEAGFRMASGATPQDVFLVVTNRGQGALTINGVTAATESGGEWLKAETAPGNLVKLTANVENVAAGAYKGSVTINTNAANTTLTVPVSLAVVAQGPPFAAVGGVLNSGSFDDALAPGGVAAVFGEQLSFQAPMSGSQIPLVRELNGVQVLVNDQPAPLYFVSYNQVNFQIPYETPVGEATIRVVRDGAMGNRITAKIVPRAPRIIQVGNNGVVVNPDGSLAIAGGRPARPGEAVVIYMVGFGATNPGAETGAAAPGAEPLARISPAPKVTIGSIFTGTVAVDPIYVGLTPSLVGLYQLNVIIPADTPDGDLPLVVTGEGYSSNIILLPVKR